MMRSPTCSSTSLAKEKPLSLMSCARTRSLPYGSGARTSRWRSNGYRAWRRRSMSPCNSRTRTVRNGLILLARAADALGFSNRTLRDPEGYSPLLRRTALLGGLVFVVELLHRRALLSDGSGRVIGDGADARARNREHAERAIDHQRARLLGVH